MHFPTRRILTALVLCLALVVPVTALGKLGFKTGDYSGSGPAAGLKAISFQAGKKRIKHLQFHVQKVVRCSDGDTRNLIDTQDGYVIPKIKIKDRKFSVTGDYEGDTATARLTFSGKLRGEEASGKLRSVVNLNDGGTCDSGKLKWEAHRR